MDSKSTLVQAVEVEEVVVAVQGFVLRFENLEVLVVYTLVISSLANFTSWTMRS